MNILLTSAVIVGLVVLVSSLEAPLLFHDQIIITPGISMCCRESSRTNTSTQIEKDCLSIALQFLGDKADLDNFKLTSRGFNAVYDQYMDFQEATFRTLFQSDSSPNSYQSLAKLLQSDPVPIIPTIYFDVDDEDFNKLFLIHQGTKKDIIRGLTAGTNYPFLSLLLRHSVKRGLYGVMVWVFEPNYVSKFMILTRKITDDGTIFYGTYGLQEMQSSMELLNNLIRTKSMEVRMGPGQRSEVWTVGKTSCSEYLYQCGTEKACACCHCVGNRMIIYYKRLVIVLLWIAAAHLILLLIISIVALI